MYRALLLALSLAFLVFPVDAQADARREPRLEAAVRVMRLVTPPERWKEMRDQMGQQMIAASEAQGAQFSPDVRAKFQRIIEEAIPYEEMIGWSAAIYAKRFTLKELKELEAFYRAPLGRKLAAEMPSIMAEVGKKMGEVMPRRVPELMKKHGLAP